MATVRIASGIVMWSTSYLLLWSGTKNVLLTHYRNVTRLTAAIQAGCMSHDAGAGGGVGGCSATTAQPHGRDPGPWPIHRPDAAILHRSLHLLLSLLAALQSSGQKRGLLLAPSAATACGFKIRAG